MITSKQCEEKYGSPADIAGTTVNEVTIFARTWMMMWEVPHDIHDAIPALPRKIYCNKEIAKPLEQALKNLIANGVADELKTFDGCYNVRQKRGSNAWSLHSWGVAVDVNAAWNGWMKTPTMSPLFVKSFKDAGFDWGGDWKQQPDGMHFQLKEV